jgi:hypothetical protein
LNSGKISGRSGRGLSTDDGCGTGVVWEWYETESDAIEGDVQARTEIGFGDVQRE